MHLLDCNPKRASFLRAVGIAGALLFFKESILKGSALLFYWSVATHFFNSR